MKWLALMFAVAIAIAVVGLEAGQSPAAESSAGPLANSCGVPTTPPPAGRGAQPTFPPGQYPVTLPAVSHLGARNDLPNPYQPGVDFGQLPAGRKWGSTASVTTAPDGTIWVVDRCGVSGAGGTTCAGPNATVAPIFQFDTSGKMLKSFGAGMFVSPHKLTVDKDGNLWVADNGSHQVFKLSSADGKSAADARQEGCRRGRTGSSSMRPPKSPSRPTAISSSATATRAAARLSATRAS